MAINPEKKYLILFVIIIIAGLYHCKDRGITMPEDNQKIEYTISNDL
jgi:hypothetical protein